MIPVPVNVVPVPLIQLPQMAGVVVPVASVIVFVVLADMSMVPML